jgi:CTP-dependent riboflavin kinase
VQRTIHGVIFSDLGQASSFMALEWVQEALRKALGFAPFPATLNLHPLAPQDAQLWQAIRRQETGIVLSPGDRGFCSARLYPVIIQGRPADDDRIKGAVLVPEVANYPKDKIEIVAPVQLKEACGVKDGDCLVLEFDD